MFRSRRRQPRCFSLRHVMGAGLSCLLFGSQIVFAATGAFQMQASYRQTVLHVQQLIQANQLQAASEALARALDQYPKDGGLENLQGVVEIEEGHVELAKRAFTEAIRHSPKLISAYLNLGRILMQTAETNPSSRGEAIHLYNKVLQMEPQNADANYESAVLLMWQGNYRQSLEHLSRLSPAARQRISVEALLCADASGAGDREEADRAAVAMEADANLTEESVMLALPALRAAHRADLIDALLTAANRRHPLSVTGLRILGLAQEAERKPDQARATLQRVYAMDSTWVAPLVDLTRIAFAQKDYKAALGFLAHARALEPNNASFAYEFGRICVRLGLLNEAIKAMDEAVKLAPDNPEYNLGMGILSSFGATPSQALPYLEKYHLMRPQDAEGWLALGSAYFRAENLQDATTWLQKAAARPETQAEARYYLGRILNEQGKYKQAIAQLSASARAQADQPQVYAELGVAYMHLKDYPKAETQLNHALALDPESYAANLALLRLYSFTHDSRRTQQLQRFKSIRNEKQKEYLDATRPIEVKPFVEVPPATQNLRPGGSVSQ